MRIGWSGQENRRTTRAGFVSRLIAIILPQPFLRGEPAAVAQTDKKRPVEIGGAFLSEIFDELVRGDAVDPQVLDLRAGADFGRELKRIQVAVERRVERDLVNALGDLARC